jgi:hypothetical protein
MCDFTKVASETMGFDAYGKMKIRFDLAHGAAQVTCLTKACAFDGQGGTLKIALSLDGPLSQAKFSSGAAGQGPDTPRLILMGPNGDDSEVMIIVVNYGEATITVNEDTNLGRSSAPVTCALSFD